METERVNQILERWGKDTIAEMIQILQAGGSRQLWKHITQELKEDLEYVQLVISMPSYGVWANSGRKPGRRPPVAALKPWAAERGIPERALYAIARKIGERGTEHAAKNFLQVFYSRYPLIKKELESAIMDDFTEAFRRSIVQKP